MPMPMSITHINSELHPLFTHLHVVSYAPPQDPTVSTDHPFDISTEYFLHGKDVLTILSLFIPILFCDLLVHVCANGFSLFCRFIIIFEFHTWYYCEVSKYCIRQIVKTTEGGKINRNNSRVVPGAWQRAGIWKKQTHNGYFYTGLVPLVTKGGGSIHRYIL